MLIEKEKIDLFLKKLSIFRGKYGEKKKDSWLTAQNYLSYNKIIKHLTGQSVIGGYSCLFTNCFVVDIDIHNPENQLSKWEYKKLINTCFGIENFISTSPRGLHLYYFLNDYLDSEFLREKLLNKLYSKIGRYSNIEIMPQPKHFLKLPFCAIENSQILEDHGRIKVIYNNPKQSIDFIDYVIDQPERHIAEILEYNPKQELRDIKKHLTRSKKQGSGSKFYQGVDNYVKNMYPEGISPGNSNTFILDVTWICYINKFSLEETQITIENFIRTIGNPQKDTIGKRLYARIQARYNQAAKNAIKFKTQSEKPTETIVISKEDQDNIDFVIEECVENIQFKRGLKKFLENLYRWDLYIKNMNKQQALYINKVYSFFFNLSYKKRLLPLPYILLKKWCKRYKKYMDYLKDKKILVLEKKYSKGNFCNHFIFNLKQTVEQTIVKLTEAEFEIEKHAKEMTTMIMNNLRNPRLWDPNSPNYYKKDPSYAGNKPDTS